MALERFWNMSFGSVTTFNCCDATCFEFKVNVLPIKIPEMTTIKAPIEINNFFINVNF